MGTGAFEARSFITEFRSWLLRPQTVSSVQLPGDPAGRQSWTATPTQTKEISENIYVDLDSDANLVRMTIEHARKNARLREFSYQEVGNSPGEARIG